ncbi:MAG: hypothetical protein JWN48_1422 [Myxococcaceae bacterium]|nr:hypothetical protein [Myxococcaceae bacterium]
MAKLASFWSSELSPLEKACLGSFVAAQHEVVLYSYVRPGDLPAGVEFRHASEILAESYMGRFITDGRPNIAHFSDYFRLNLFLKTSATWIDCDLIAYRPFDTAPEDNLLVREGRTGINNSLLRIADRQLLTDCLERTEALLDVDVMWAATQNVIIKALARHPSTFALQPASEFVPVHFSDFDKLLLPEYRDHCESLCAEAKTIHLYNNVMERIGYHKNLLPPVGSFLYELLVGSGDHGFTDVYPADVVRKLLEAWRSRFSGEDLGVRSVVRQFIPSLKRSVRRLVR